MSPPKPRRTATLCVSVGCAVDTMMRKAWDTRNDVEPSLVRYAESGVGFLGRVTSWTIEGDHCTYDLIEETP